MIHGPLIPILTASAPTVFLFMPLSTKNVSPRVSIVSSDSDKLPLLMDVDARL
uniref:Uridine-cytidine kinase C-like isoform X2 n=1 Tax=Rhizophora mucronata TaxID=61149 RepID=A0A2P2JN87_RHIMU